MAPALCFLPLPAAAVPAAAAPPRWTCRKRVHGGPAGSKTRSRAAKRSALYARMARYREHFLPLLEAELGAEQAQRAGSGPGVGGLRARGAGRLFCDVVVELRGGDGRALPVWGTLARGDLAVLRREGLHDDGEGLLAVVVERRRRRVLVAVRDGLEARELLAAAHGSWALEAGTSAVGYKRCVRAVERLTEVRQDVSALDRLILSAFQGRDGPGLEELARCAPPQLSKDAVDKSVGLVAPRSLNSSQLRAVSAALRRTLTLIQGPPGSGKTSTAAWIVACAAAAGKKVLVTAFSNVAADNLLAAVVEARGRDHDVLRVGKVPNVRKDLWKYTVDARLEARLRAKVPQYPSSENAGHSMDTKDSTMRRARDNKSEEVSRYELEEKISAEIVKRARIVITTCVSSGSELLAFQKFPILVVDEACQATEPSNLVPLSQDTEQLVLIGDQCQLPATVLSGPDSPLSISLFERFVSTGIPPILLDKQYRMHPAIASFPAARFYDGRLLSVPRPKDRMLPKELRFPFGRDPVLFVNCEGTEVQVDVGPDTAPNELARLRVSEGSTRQESLEGSLAGRAFSYANPAEADLVVRIVRHLRTGFEAEEIGVITPYSAQAQRIRDLFASESTLGGGLEIKTVDGFQGREKEAVVLSTTRCNKRGQVGFLSDWRRLNVALTRARRALVVVGNARTLTYDDVWRDWLSWIRTNNCFSESNFE